LQNLEVIDFLPFVEIWLYPPQNLARRQNAVKPGGSRPQRGKRKRDAPHPKGSSPPSWHPTSVMRGFYAAAVLFHKCVTVQVGVRYGAE